MPSLADAELRLSAVPWTPPRRSDTPGDILAVRPLRPALVALAAALLPSAALAQSPPPSPPARAAARPYRLHLALDALTIGTSAAMWLGPDASLRELVRLGRCPCDPAQLNDLDRPTAGVSLGDVTLASNVATGVLLAAPVVFDAFDVWRSRGSVPEWVEDTLVIGEALMIGGAINEFAKIAFQRPRPSLYGVDPGDARLDDPNSYMSFYSTSAAEIFTALVAGSVTYALRHPRGAGRWIYLASATLLASGFGLSRVLTGKHFTTDVLAAAGMGSLIGVGIPLLHTRDVPVTLGAAAAPGAAMITATIVNR